MYSLILTSMKDEKKAIVERPVFFLQSFATSHVGEESHLLWSDGTKAELLGFIWFLALHLILNTQSLVWNMMLKMEILQNTVPYWKKTYWIQKKDDVILGVVFIFQQQVGSSGLCCWNCSERVYVKAYWWGRVAKSKSRHKSNWVFGKTWMMMFIHNLRPVWL